MKKSFLHTTLIAIRTAISMLLIFCIALIFFIPGLLCLLLPARWRYENKIFHGITYVVYTLIVKATFLPVTIVGKHHMPTTPAVIVANHQSALDIPLVGMLLHAHPHVWLALAVLRNAWYLRYIVTRVAVLVDVSSSSRAARSLIAALKLLEESTCHAVVFPEGGRFVDGQVHDFFSGFVILAKKLKRPVVPLRIFNLQRAFPPGSLLVHRVPIKIVIGEPMQYEETDTDESFKERVYAWFLAQ